MAADTTYRCRWTSGTRSSRAARRGDHHGGRGQSRPEGGARRTAMQGGSFRRMVRLVLAVSLAAAAACGHSSGGMNGPSMNNKIGGDTVEYKSPVVSWDILDREPVANEVQVRHILIGWKDLEEAYGGQLPDSARARTRADAEAEIKSLMGQLKAGADFNALMRE